MLHYSTEELEKEINPEYKEIFEAKPASPIETLLSV